MFFFGWPSPVQAQTTRDDSQRGVLLIRWPLALAEALTSKPVTTAVLPLYLSTVAQARLL